MEGSYESVQIIKYPSAYDESCIKLSFSLLPLFDVRVFYVRFSGIDVNESTPEFLFLHHIPLSPDTLLEINGVRSNMNSDGDSSILRKDRVDKNCEEITFVNTDSIRLNGSMKFEVCDKEQCFLSCVLEMCNEKKKWSMICESEMRQNSEIEVYVAGCFLGKPIILSRTLQVNCRKKNNRKGMLDVIPEYETTLSHHHHHGLDLQVAEYKRRLKQKEEDYKKKMYLERTGYIMEGEDGGEVSWFNAGVRVGVGLGLGICVGVGIGVSLLVRSYQTTTRNFKRRFI